MITRLVFSSFVAAAIAISLAACNTSNPNPTPTVGPTCAPPNGTQTVLVYPAPSATGVTDSNGQIVIGSTAALPTGTSTDNWDIVIVDNVFPGGTTMPGALTTTTPPFPTPNATPSFANPVYQTQAFGSPFAAGQTVKVFINNLATNCSPLLLGQFST
jgi:hypothetical protein